MIHLGETEASASAPRSPNAATATCSRPRAAAGLLRVHPDDARAGAAAGACGGRRVTPGDRGAVARLPQYGEDATADAVPQARCLRPPVGARRRAGAAAARRRKRVDAPPARGMTIPGRSSSEKTSRPGTDRKSEKSVRPDGDGRHRHRRRPRRGGCRRRVRRRRKPADRDGRGDPGSGCRGLLRPRLHRHGPGVVPLHFVGTGAGRKARGG